MTNRTEKPSYKAYIAGDECTKAFDHCYGQTPKSAIAAVKRRNSPDWRDCVVWVVEILGEEMGELRGERHLYTDTHK